MPTPHPETGSEYIEIADFSPGIHSEFHGTLPPKFTSDPIVTGTLFGNGIARVEGTERCRADKAGALVPLPKALPTGDRDHIRPGIIGASRPYRYVLDAQIGNGLVDGSEVVAAPFEEASRTPIHIMWGTSIATLAGENWLVIGREYRHWSPEYTGDEVPRVDFMIGLVDGVSSEFTLIPIGSLAKARFYYGFTSSGKAEAAGDPDFRPLWQYPVVVAMAATPWVKWGKGNRWHPLDLAPDVLSYIGWAPPRSSPGGGPASFSPAIGLKGEGTTIIAMQLADDGSIDIPFNALHDSRWAFHYSERGNVPQNDIIADIAGGPINPYMILAHQGRVVIPDRRRSAPAFGTDSRDPPDHGFIDDLLFFSDYNLPLQDFAATPLATDKGQTNAAFESFPQATYEVYNKLLVAEDRISEFGTIGVVTIDQLFLVKHYGGGALVSGDLDEPTVTRLPYIESTGGLICKGTHTPIGFVYGSDNGIFTWQGGDASQKLSPQLDGFFWDHTNASALEQYAGARGRMAYWNSLVFVPNNYVYDVETQAWWQLQRHTLDPVEPATLVPFNCYDVDNDGVLYAWPYKHIAELPSGVVFPGSPTDINSLSVADEASFSAPSELDIRFVLGNSIFGGGNLRTIVGQWEETGNQRSWLVRLTTDDKIDFSTSTDGTAATGITVTSDDPLYGVAGLQMGRVTWRASDGRVNFSRKTVGDIPSQLDHNNDAAWKPISADKFAAAAQLHDSTQPLVVGNQGDNGLGNPMVLGDFHALYVNTTINGASFNALRIYPEDFPPDLDATSFVSTSEHTVDVNRAASGPQLTLIFANLDLTPPTWYTFDENTLDDDYSWQSHPLVQTRDHVTSFQAVDLVATGTSRAPHYFIFPATVGNFLSTPDAPEHDIPGDLSVFARTRPTSWLGSTPVIAGKWETLGQLSWYLQILTDGKLQFVWSPDGTIASQRVAVSTKSLDVGLDWVWPAVTFDADNGAAGVTVRFWTSDQESVVDEDGAVDGAAWVQLGQPRISAGTSSIFASNSQIEVGTVLAGAASPFGGDIGAVGVYDGHGASGFVPGGTQAFYYSAPDDLGNADAAIASFVASSGQTVTVNRSGAPSTTIPFTTIAAILVGFDETGDAEVFTVNTFELAYELDPQFLRQDVEANFNAAYTTLQLRAINPNGEPAPKIHRVRLATKPRSTLPRHG